MRTRFFVALGIAAMMASAPSSAAKNPKGCSRSGARAANPHGSVLVQTSTSSSVATRDVRVFGNAQAITGRATIVPDITAESGPKASTSQLRPTAPAPAKRRKGKRTAFLSPTANPSYSSC